jgi:hypothetical protein
MAKKKAQNEITIRSSAIEKATIRNFRIVQTEGERIVELELEATIKKYLIVQNEGERQVEFDEEPDFDGERVEESEEQENVYNYRKIA